MNKPALCLIFCLVLTPCSSAGIAGFDTAKLTATIAGYAEDLARAKDRAKLYTGRFSLMSSNTEAEINNQDNAAANLIVRQNQTETDVHNNNIKKSLAPTTDVCITNGLSSAASQTRQYRASAGQPNPALYEGLFASPSTFNANELPPPSDAASIINTHKTETDAYLAKHLGIPEAPGIDMSEYIATLAYTDNGAPNLPPYQYDKYKMYSMLISPGYVASAPATISDKVREIHHLATNNLPYQLLLNIASDKKTPSDKVPSYFQVLEEVGESAFIDRKGHKIALATRLQSDTEIISSQVLRTKALLKVSRVLFSVTEYANSLDAEIALAARVAAKL